MLFQLHAFLFITIEHSSWLSLTILKGRDHIHQTDTDFAWISSNEHKDLTDSSIEEMNGSIC